MIPRHNGVGWLSESVTLRQMKVMETSASDVNRFQLVLQVKPYDMTRYTPYDVIGPITVL